MLKVRNIIFIKVKFREGKNRAPIINGLTIQRINPPPPLSRSRWAVRYPGFVCDHDYYLDIIPSLSTQAESTLFSRHFEFLGCFFCADHDDYDDDLI